MQAVYRHNPQEDFWGLGADSSKDNRVSYLVDYTDYTGRAIVRPVPWLEAGTRFGRLDGSIGRGTDKRFPSIEERFTDATAPGLAEQPDFSFAELFGAVDYRDQEDNARAGGLYSLSWREYSDLDFDRYSFRAVDLLLQQFVPIFDKKRVFAAAGTPAVRGDRQRRGTDRAVLLQADARRQHEPPRLQRLPLPRRRRRLPECRVPMGGVLGLDMALFSDWGTVAPNVGQLKLSRARERVRHRIPLQHVQVGLVPRRHRLRRRRRADYFFKFSKAF